MKVYVYSKGSEIIRVSCEAGELYMDAWDDFKKRYFWDAFYPDQETEDDAFIEFCDDLTTGGIFDEEFRVTECSLDLG